MTHHFCSMGHFGPPIFKIICIISGVDVYLALVEVMEVRYPETLKYVFVINGRLSVINILN